MEQTHVEIAVALNEEDNFLGAIVGPEDVDCHTLSRIKGSTCNGRLSEMYSLNQSLQKSDLSRAWFHLDLKVTA